MAIRAVHDQWGAVFAHLPDLGCRRDWTEVWKVRPIAPLTCDECRHPMYAKVSSSQLRFFAHAPGAPKCALAEESPAHHLLKLELATAAREAGAPAELEVRGPDGAWRADVLASDLAGGWKTALEAQLSPITPEDIAARAERMLGDGVASVWFSDRVRAPWFGTVPWARLQTVDGALAVVEGLAKFSGNRWEAGPQVSVGEFLRWVFAGRVVPHRRRAPVRSPLGAWNILWTAPQYSEAESAHLAAQERRKREQEEQERALRERWRQERDGVARLERELDRGPLVHGWADQRWTLARIRTLIGRLFHVSYTVEGTWLLLKRYGWSWQQHARRAIERDDAAVEVWTMETWPRVRAPRRRMTAGSFSRTKPDSR